MPEQSHRLNLLTLISISLPAFALEPFVHEVLGHTVTAWLTGVKVILISSTAMQTEGGSRLIPASGPLANLFFGVSAYLLFQRIPRFNSMRLFLWLFAFANLFIGTGYVLFSGAINFGDAAYVIAGLRPAWLYRAGLIILGYTGYRYSVGLAARDAASQIRNGSLVLSDLPPIVYPSIVAGSILHILASALNPISPSLILYDGVSSAAGIAIGFGLIPGVVTQLLSPGAQGSGISVTVSSAPDSSAPPAIPFSLPWILFSALCTILFLVFLGRGFRP